MHWERRLREMILAGGALVAAACSSNGASRGAQDPPDATESSVGVGNACPDPCSCTGPDSAACEQENQQFMACLARGGSFDGVECVVPSEPAPLPVPEDGSPEASTPDGGALDREAGPGDAALLDAETDATASDAADGAGE